QGLIVSGCMPQRFRDELPKLLPEVDVFMGIDQVQQVGALVSQALRHRAEKIANPPRSGGRSKVKVLQRMAELEGKAEGTPGKAEGKRQKAKAEGSGHETKLEPMVEVHARPTYIPDFATPRFRLTPRHFAYVKI